MDKPVVRDADVDFALRLRELRKLNPRAAERYERRIRQAIRLVRTRLRIS